MRIRIVARRDGFRRAGIAHSATPTTYDASQFTVSQLEALKDEPALIVDVIDGDEGGKPMDDTAKGKKKKDKDSPSEPPAS